MDIGVWMTEADVYHPMPPASAQRGRGLHAFRAGGNGEDPA